MRVDIAIQVDERVSNHLAAQWGVGILDNEQIEQALIGAMLRAVECEGGWDDIHADLEELSGDVHAWYEAHPLIAQGIQVGLFAR